MRLVGETLVENPAACRQHRNRSSIQGKTAAVPHFILHWQLRAELWAQTLRSSGSAAQLDMHWHLVGPGARKVRLGAVDYRWKRRGEPGVRGQELLQWTATLFIICPVVAKSQLAAIAYQATKASTALCFTPYSVAHRAVERLRGEWVSILLLLLLWDSKSSKLLICTILLHRSLFPCMFLVLIRQWMTLKRNFCLYKLWRCRLVTYTFFFQSFCLIPAGGICSTWYHNFPIF